MLCGEPKMLRVLHHGTDYICYNFPKFITADCVKSFDTVDKGHVEVYILFLTFVLEIPG